MRTAADACGRMRTIANRRPHVNRIDPHRSASIRIYMHMRTDAGACGMRADGRGGLRTSIGNGLHATACVPGRPHRYQRFHINVLARPVFTSIIHDLHTRRGRYMRSLA